jgi:hypothetical protein
MCGGGGGAGSSATEAIVALCGGHMGWDHNTDGTISRKDAKTGKKVRHATCPDARQIVTRQATAALTVPGQRMINSGSGLSDMLLHIATSSHVIWLGRD